MVMGSIGSDWRINVEEKEHNGCGEKKMEEFAVGHE
jgi:hypothetical protein